MTDLATGLNDAIRAASPALHALLSPLGRRVAYPPDIPFQAAQARGKTFNGTIGQITDGAGHALPVPSLAAGLAGLSDELANRALLYSPVDGMPDLRRLWRARQRREVAAEVPSTTPFLTVGLSHGISIVADLFGGEGRPVAVPAPFWGNYRQAFAVRTGARMLSRPIYVDGQYDPGAIANALADEPAGEPAIAVLNLPSNPGGYSLTVAERQAVLDKLRGVADERPLLVLCDDAYAGLVYEEAIPKTSMFWELIDLHPNLVPVKVDGSTKEISFFGGRVGFLTFPFEPGSEVEKALENKVKCMLRSALGSPVATSQALLLAALESDSLEAELEVVRVALGRRYRVLKEALEEVRSDDLRPLPFNSGCFALMELDERLGLASETVRQHLLDHHDTGVVSLAPRYLRVAFCSVAEEALPELVRRLALGVDELTR